jgi:hypothetical protein
LACGSSGSDFDAGTDASPPKDASFDSIFPTDAPGNCKPCTDFPSQPILDTGVPANAPTLFQDPGSSSGGPCLVEPQVGNGGANPMSLFPNNWLRPRFRFVPPNGQNLFEIRMHAASQQNDLVVYTTATTWTMPKAMWTALASHSADDPITTTVRGAPFDGTKLTSPPSTGTSGPWQIAPASADGAIVYWTTSNGSAFKGFHVADESVVSLYTPTNVNNAATQCIGCHSSTPDGAYVAMSASTQAGNGDPANPLLRSSDGLGTAPPFLSGSAATLLGRTDQELPTSSKAHWATGDRVLVSMLLLNNVQEIVWTDLETSSTAQNTGWGVIARGGDGTNGAGNPAFSHDGKTIAYHRASTVSVAGQAANADIYTVPYNNRAGGTATALLGASAASKNEFYPAFSADDAYIAFSRADTGISYNNSGAEVFIVPSAGSTSPTRLAANDPVACSGVTSPGVTNSWPKWSPAVGSFAGRSFYWIVFSSTRAQLGHPQLYMAGIEIDNGTIAVQGAAIYLWNQPQAESNHTPAWDTFGIPPVN